jgi:glutamine amidotransferase
MEAEPVTVLRTGVANLASVLAGLRRAGAEPRITDAPNAVADAPRLVLPGVGSFGAAMTQLRRCGLEEPLCRRIRDGRPTLAICLGLQLLGAGSEESPDSPGLRVFDERATRFDSGVRVPQLGWNSVHPDAGCARLEPGYAYFANSYRLLQCPAGWQVAWADHGGRFVAAIQRGGVLACQFHPELSGAWGVRLMQRWLEATRPEASPC